jgi:hypothetical protein
MLEERTLLSQSGGSPWLLAALEAPIRTLAVKVAPTDGPPRQPLQDEAPPQAAPVLVPAAADQSRLSFVPALLHVTDTPAGPPALPRASIAPAGLISPLAFVDSLPTMPASAATAPAVLASTPARPPTAAAVPGVLVSVAPPPQAETAAGIATAALAAARPPEGLFAAEADCVGPYLSDEVLRAVTAVTDETPVGPAAPVLADAAVEEAPVTEPARSDRAPITLPTADVAAPAPAMLAERGGELLPFLAALFVTTAVWHICASEHKDRSRQPHADRAA